MFKNNVGINHGYDSTADLKNPNIIAALSQENNRNLDETYELGEHKSENVFLSAGRYLKKYYKPNRENISRYFLKRFPFFDWIRTYDLKSDLVKDLTAGLTVSILIVRYILEIKFIFVFP